MKMSIYELYVDKFAGNFKSLTEKLGYFNKLGVTALHILPHYPSPMVDGGYDVSDYRNVRRELGTLKDFEIFTKAARKHGLRVIVDLILNHVSVEHEWFKEKGDYFLWSKSGKELANAPNAFPHLKPSNWIYNKARGEYYFATFYPEQADLNWDNPAVLKEILAVMDFWVEHGVGGFRLDAASHLVKREGTRSKGLPETHAILRKLRSHVNKHYPDAVLLAEVHDSVAEVKKYFGDGDECHLVYHFPLAEAVFLKLVTGDGGKLDKILRESADIPEGSRWALFLRNHDELSMETFSDEERKKIFEFADPDRKYDFKKGRGLSMRLASIFQGEKEKILSAFESLFKLPEMLPGVPIIYYGEEIGMENAALNNKIFDTRYYMRGAFDWREAERQISDPESLFNAVARLVRRNS